MDDLNKQWEQTSKVNLVKLYLNCVCYFKLGKCSYGVEESDATGDNRARTNNPITSTVRGTPKKPAGGSSRGP
jgi:hypothetical protein